MKLFLAGVSRKTAVSFLSIFSSIFIYQQAHEFGYGYKTSILVAIVFYIVLYIIKGAAMMAAEDYSRIHGFKNSIEASLLPFTVAIISFILADYSLYFLIPAVIFWGIHAGFYWWGYHGYFIKSGDYKSFGKELGEVGVLETLAAILTPVLGAVFVREFGFRSVYILAFFFMLLTTFLISKAKDKRQKHDTDFEEMSYLIKKHKSSAIAYAGTALEGSVYGSIWPLFLFIFSENILEMGSIISVAVLAASIIGLMTGGIEDRAGEKKLVSFGTPIITISWLLRLFSRSSPVFIVADSMWRVGQKMVNMPMQALTYKKAVKKYTARAILFRELAVTFGASLGLMIAAIFFYFIPSFMTIFIVTIIFSILPLAAVFGNELDG